MSRDWLLVETLGDEPAVAARGRQIENLVPISAFLRRHPHLMAVQAAIVETVRAGQGLSSITPKNDRVIRTEVVEMTDGRIHGVQVWTGPAGEEPPERPTAGPLIWDLTTGVVTDTPESLGNAGWGAETAAAPPRAWTDNPAVRNLSPDETKLLSMLVGHEPGKAFTGAWDVTDDRGNNITVGFVARACLETRDDDTRGEHAVWRAINWRAESGGTAAPPSSLAQRALSGLARPGVHRMLVELDNWTLLRWIDEPPTFFDWQARDRRDQTVHPADARQMARMTIEFNEGTAAGILRLCGTDDDWTPVYVTVNRVELPEGDDAALVTLRLPTDEELAAADLDDIGEYDHGDAGRDRSSEP